MADSNTTTTSTACESSALDLKIQQFETDVGIAHEIIHGDATTDVSTESGPIPTFAKVVATYEQQWQNTVNSMQGVVTRQFCFEKGLIWYVKHDMNSFTFMKSIRNLDGVEVMAHVNVLDANTFQVEFTEPEAGCINVIFLMNV